MVAQTQH